MANKIRVIVVDDSALVRGLLAEIIERQPDMTCIGAAADPIVAREMIRNLNPDVITLDVEMPRMDGIDFLSRLMRLRPMPVVMVSTLTERGADVTLKALELGAVDFVAKPKIGVSDGLRQLGADITEKIRTAARARVQRLAAPPAAGAAPAKPVSMAQMGRLSTEKIVFLGASTGGTEATREVPVSYTHLHPAPASPAPCKPSTGRARECRSEKACGGRAGADARSVRCSGQAHPSSRRETRTACRVILRASWGAGSAARHRPAPGPSGRRSGRPMPADRARRPGFRRGSLARRSS